MMEQLAQNGISELALGELPNGTLGWLVIWRDGNQESIQDFLNNPRHKNLPINRELLIDLANGSQVKHLKSYR